MIHVFSKARENGWEVKAIVEDAKHSNIYHVLVIRKNAPFKDAPYSIQTFTTNNYSFYNGRYDLTEEEAYSKFRSLNW